MLNMVAAKDQISLAPQDIHPKTGLAASEDLRCHGTLLRDTGPTCVFILQQQGYIDF